LLGYSIFSYSLFKILILQDEEPDSHYNSRRMPPRRQFEDDFEAEARAERRIIHAKVKFD
jgi:hypothetical protein